MEETPKNTLTYPESGRDVAEGPYLDFLSRTPPVHVRVSPDSQATTVKENVDENSAIRVLVVDDNKADFLLIRDMLSNLAGVRYEADWADSYQAGMAAIQRSQHDVYLIDYRLGPSDGLQFLKEVQASGCLHPIILMTGAGSHTIDVQAMKAGAADYLVKGQFDEQLLERSIRYALEHCRMLRKVAEREEYFRLLFEKSMDGILIGDAEGNCREANPAAADLVGYPRERLLTMKLPDLFGVNTEARGGNLPREGAPVYEGGEFSFFRPNGDRRIAEYLVCRLAANLHLCILRDVTEHKLLEQEILEISEKEQRRIGQDLHDGLCQHLTGIVCFSKVLEQKLASKAMVYASDAAQIARLVDQAIGETRDLARGLYPVDLDADFEEALRELALRTTKLSNVNCELESDEPLILANKAAAIHLYRITQEAINNAIRHGKAVNITIRLESELEVARLTIVDDGVGFPQGTLRSKGMGLRLMNYRAGMIDGSLTVTRGQGGGTVVTCQFRNPQQPND